MMDKLQVNRFDDLEHKIAFLPQKVEPATEFWKVVLNVINKTEAESREEEKKESIVERLSKVFKKKS